MPDLPILPLSRRRFLATTGGAMAGAVLLGACGGDDDTSDPGSTTTTSAARGDGLVLAAYLQGLLNATGITTRLVFGLADSEGLLTYDATPEELELSIIGPDAAPTVEKVTVQRHGMDLPRAYFPLERVFDEPGIYSLRATPEGSPPAEMAFEVREASQIPVLKQGDAVPPLVTPTTADAMGIDPLCSADPVCPYHDVTLQQALGEGRPIALSVSTPGFCTSAACSPMHGVFLAEVAKHPDVRAIHCEVYVHPNVNRTDLAPLLRDLHMPSEPSVFLIGSDGITRQRLDAIVDADELGPKLAALS